MAGASFLTVSCTEHIVTAGCFTSISNSAFRLGVVIVRNLALVPMPSTATGTSVNSAIRGDGSAKLNSELQSTKSLSIGLPKASGDRTIRRNTRSAACRDRSCRRGARESNSHDGGGWDAILADFDTPLNELDPGYVVDQVKEKFSGLRYYFSPSTADPETRAAMHLIVNGAEAKAWKTCEISGRNDGMLGRWQGRSWMRTLSLSLYGPQGFEPVQ